MSPEAKRIIKRLGLEPLPGEGGYFRRVWEGASAGGRPAGTSILFLITEQDFSALHRLDADEVWHFHGGDPVEHVRLGPAGSIESSVLGVNLVGGHEPQVVARAGTWQGARLASRAGTEGWALVGCTMAPGWTKEGTEIGERGLLLAAYPQAKSVIEALTRPHGF